jgi:hypothetical protein
MHVPISKVNALKTMENNMSVHHDMSIGQIRQNIINNVNTLQKAKARRRYRDASVNFQEFSSQTDARHLSSIVLDPQQSQRTFSIDQTREIFSTPKAPSLPKPNLKAITAKVNTNLDDRTHYNLTRERYTLPEENEFRFQSKSPTRRMYELHEN